MRLSASKSGMGNRRGRPLWTAPRRRPIHKKAFLGIVGIRPELHTERPARGDDAEVFVKDDQRFSNGVYNRLRERTGVFDFAELVFKHGRTFPRRARIQHDAAQLGQGGTEQRSDRTLGPLLEELIFESEQY